MSVSRRQFIKYAISAPIGLAFATSGLAASRRLQGKILELSGDVFINKNLATPSSIIRSGDQVTTAFNGRIVFSMAQDVYLLQAGSSLELVSQDGAIISGLRLLTGGLLSVFGTRGDKRNSSQTKIYTRTATIGIRGTGVYLNSQPDKLYFCTCYGKTELDLGHNHLEQIEAKHHNAVDVTGTTANSMKMLATEVKNHTDDELRLLEKYAGRIPLFDVV